MVSPLLTIALPVYNAVQYLRETVDSILTQDFANLELILADNASTDGTQELCAEFAAADSRVRVLGSEKNRGMTWNFNRVVPEVRTPLFKWATYDDPPAPGFLSACVAALDANPTAILAYPMTTEIDGDGRFLRHRPPLGSIDAATPFDRYRQLIYGWDCEPLLGVLRTAALRRTRLFRDCTFCDYVLLCELALIGRLIEVPEPLYRLRVHPETSLRKYKRRSDRLALFNPALASRITFPVWREGWEHFRAIGHARLTFRERWLCRLAFGRWVQRHVRLLSRDAICGLLQHIARPFAELAG